MFLLSDSGDTGSQLLTIAWNSLCSDRTHLVHRNLPHTLKIASDDVLASGHLGVVHSRMAHLLMEALIRSLEHAVAKKWPRSHLTVSLIT